MTKLSKVSLLAIVPLLLAGCGGSTGGNGGGGGGNPTTITFTFSDSTPAVVATSIGSASFTRQAVNGKTLTLSVPSGTSNFAVAYLCNTPSSALENIFEANTADGSSFTLLCVGSASTGQTDVLTGSMDASAIPGATSVYIAAAAANSSSFVSAGVGGSFSVKVSSGNDRIEALAYSGNGTPLNLLAARNFSAQAVPGILNNGNSVVFGAADATTSQPLSYTNLPSGYSTPITTAYLSSSGTLTFPVTAPAATEYSVLPSASVESGDYYWFLSSASNSAHPQEMVLSETSVASPGPVSIAFPPPWSYAGPVPAALPTFDMSYNGFTGTKGIYDTAFLGWNVGNSYSTITLVASANYQNGSTRLALPDLSGTSGFIAPVSGTSVLWGAVIQQWGSGVLDSAHNSGNVLGVENTGYYTVP